MNGRVEIKDVLDDRTNDAAKRHPHVVRREKVDLVVMTNGSDEILPVDYRAVVGAMTVVVVVVDDYPTTDGSVALTYHEEEETEI